MPLETLPGWPAAPPVSVVGTLLLLVGVPVLVILIVAGIAAIRPAKNSYDAMHEREAFWVEHNSPEALTEMTAEERAAISSGG